MRNKLIKFNEKYERLLADNKRMAKKLICLNSQLIICQQKCLSIESAFDLSQKLVQHLKTENQLLKSSAPDLFSLSHPLEPQILSPLLAITDGTEIGIPLNETQSENQSTDNNPNNLCKSDLIAVQYEKEIKELREELELLKCLPLDRVVVTKEDQIKAKSYLSDTSDLENEEMDVDIDVISTTSERNNVSKEKCKYCGRKFTEFSAFEEHKSLHKSSDGQQIRCAEDLCGHQFDSKHDLKEHLKKIHKNSDRNKTYSSLIKKFQINSSQNKRVFKCYECDKELASMHSLRSHQKAIHNVVTTFKCKFSGCEQKFEKSSELRAHEEEHRKNKSSIEFKQTPNKTPVLSENVDNETEKNSNETPVPTPPKRPFPCKYEGCNHSYIHKTSLKKHEEKFHSNSIICSSLSNTNLDTVVTTPQDFGARLQLLNLFVSEQGKIAQF